MKKLLSILLFCAGSVLAETFTPAVSIAASELREVASAKTGTRYELFVSLPEGYATSQQQYPVLYALDGWHFPLLAFLQNNSRFSKRMPPVIIVNVSHGAKNAIALRTRDFTPSAVTSVPGSGGAPAFLEFMEQELIPLIDKTYRTNPVIARWLGTRMAGCLHCMRCNSDRRCSSVLSRSVQRSAGTTNGSFRRTVSRNSPRPYGWICQ